MKRKSYLKRNLYIIALLLLFLYLFLGFRLYFVQGESMAPVFHTGDRLLVSRWSYGFPRIFHTGYYFQWKKPSIDDIMVFHSPLENSLSVKRCAGREGDTLMLIHDTFYLNGQPLPPGKLPPAAPFRDGVIAPDWVFFLGDNTGDSVDSRYYGPLSMEYVLGRVLLAGRHNG